MGPTPPPPVLIPFDPITKRINDAKPDNINDGTFKNAFKANLKNINLGLEMFKFVSPGEVAWWTYDTSKKANPGFQGPLTNNYAWWNKAQMWYIDPQDIKTRLHIQSTAGTALSKDQISDLDSWWQNPATINQFLSPSNHWHNPGDFTGDSLHPNIATNDGGWFGVTHRSSSWLYGGPTQGAYSGTLYDVNPFAGVAGGYSDNKYNVNNTWNHFQVALGDKKNLWDFGVSDGYQSAFAIDNQKGDWGTLNNTLTDISKQAVFMKNNHFGYDLNDGSTGFHKSQTGINPLATTKTWDKIGGDPNLRSDFSALSADPYNNGQATQAPSYYEIIESGAWSQWYKGFDVNTWKSNTDNKPALTLDNIDDSKFYYFTKAMLESKRRGFQALANLLGKVKNLSNDVSAKLADGTATQDDWKKAIYGDASKPVGEAPGTAAQCKDIQDWYNNVTKNQAQENTVMNFMFYMIGHAFMNNLEKMFSLDVIYGGNAYGDNGPFKTFKYICIPADYKYLTNDANSSSIKNLKADIIAKALAAGLIQQETKKEKQGDKEVDVPTGNYTGDAQILAINNYDISLPDADKKDFNKIYEKLLPLYNQCEAKILDMKSKGQSSEAIKALLTLENALAPITELFHKDNPTTNDSLSFKVPTINFAFRDNASVNDLDWDYLAREPLIPYASGATYRSYDAYAQFRGFGLSWLGNGNNRRDGVQSLFRINPVAGMATSYVVNDGGDAVDSSRQLDPTGKFLLTADPNWLLDPNTRANLYGYKDGTYHWNVAAPADHIRGMDLEVNQNAAYAGATFNYQGVWYIGNENLLRFNLNLLRASQYKSQKQNYEDQKDDKAQSDLEDERQTAKNQAERRADDARVAAQIAAQKKSSQKK